MKPTSLGEGEGIHALALGAAARMSHAARKNLILATATAAAAADDDVVEDGGGCVRAGASVMRVSYITVTPDVDQSSNRGYR